ncbi:unnamed protein product [Peniophora sp. CBMAI 1063]|nr:unnamed protein product [Peniophora sp. CBMAI 1063]
MSTETSIKGILALPNEILLRVFSHVAREESESDAFARTLAPAWAMSIPHVCSRWRTLALGSTTLWTRVSPSFSTFWYDEFAERSMDTFLHATVSLLDEEKLPDDELMTEMTSFSEEMEIILRPGRQAPEDEDEEVDDDDDYLLYRLGDEASKLHTLRITQPKSGTQLDLPLPFPDDHSSLRNLTISCPCLGDLRWAFDLFENLTSLTIHAVMSYSVLRAVCRTATKLEQLTYGSPLSRDAGFHITAPYKRDENPLIMSSLRELTIKSFAQPESENFLGNLELPVLERLYLRFRFTDDKGIRQTFQDLKPLFRPWARPKHVEFLVHQEKEVALLLGPSPVDIPNAIIVIESAGLAEDTSSLLLRLYPLIALDSVRTLGLADASSPEEMFKASEWCSLLKPFTAVEDLWCMQPTHQELHKFELFRALWPGQQWEPYALTSGDATEDLLLPALRKISFTRRPIRFAGFREPGAVAVFEEWPASRNEPHSYELLRLANTVGRLDDRRRAVEYVFEDVEGMEEKVVEMLNREGGRDVRMVGSHIVSKKEA